LSIPELNESVTELTTAATDLLLGVQCVILAAGLARARIVAGVRQSLWIWVFGLTAMAALLGALAHGIALPASVVGRLFMAIYLALGIVVALFLAGAVLDCFGEGVARRLIPVAVLVGAAFFVVTQLGDAGFLLFVIYEAAAMLLALGLYLALAIRRRLAGSGLMAAAILLNLGAAAVQASDLSLRVILPFDHNGLFHLLQMVAIAVLSVGLRRGFGTGNRPLHP